MLLKLSIYSLLIIFTCESACGLRIKQFNRKALSAFRYNGILMQTDTSHDSHKIGSPSSHSLINVVRNCKSTIASCGRGAMRLAVVALITLTFQSTAAFAASGSSSPSFFRKVLDGVTVSGNSFRNMKAGDTRGEFAALLNAVGTGISFLVMGVFAFFIHSAREMKEKKAYLNELNKVKEYKENMYFEAVQEVLTKLEDPKLKGSTKANLQKQLKELDPDGAIEKFLAGGPRPDISDRIGVKSPARKPKSGDGNTLRKPKTKPSDAPSSSSKAAPKATGNAKPTPKATKPPAASTTGTGSGTGSGTGVRKPGVSPSGSNSGNARGGFQGVLGELFLSLKGVMPDELRRKLVESLKSRLDKLTDLEKKKATLAKITSKLGDLQYWKDYAKDL